MDKLRTHVTPSFTTDVKFALRNALYFIAPDIRRNVNQTTGK